jgi:hypothetical protein
MKSYGRVEVWIHVLLTSALVGSEWSPGERAPRYPLDRRVGPTAGQDDKEKWKFFTRTRTPTLGRPNRSQSLQTELPRLFDTTYDVLKYQMAQKRAGLDRAVRNFRL